MLPGLRTSHDWAHDLDRRHVASVRDRQGSSPVDCVHLVLEVLEYAVDEAWDGGTTSIVVVVGEDGTVAVEDDGRGTDTRLDLEGRPMVKPVMATRDLRFFDRSDAPPLVDGSPRQGISVACAVSASMTHENRRAEGAWHHEYVDGLPTGPPTALDPDGRTGTLVRFRPDPLLVPGGLDVDRLRELVALVDVPARAVVTLRQRPAA